MKRDQKQGPGHVDVLLEACDPVERSALTTARVQGALDEIGTLITGFPIPQVTPKRSIGRPARTGLVVAAAALVTAAVAVGGVLSAHTGLFPTQSEQAIGGPGEALNPTAANFRAVALQVASDVPFPREYESWREFLISNEIRTDAGSGLVSTGALRGWFAASAFCAWVQSWRRAALDGNATATAQATQTISQAPGWKAVTAEDPNPDPLAANDPGAESGTLFGWMLPYRDAVLAGDRARVEDLLAAGYGGGRCWSSDPAWMAQLRAHRDTWGRLSQKELAQKYGQFLTSGR